MNKIQDTKKKYIYLFLLLLSVVYIILNNNYTYFWFDEGYSISLIRYSYSDIWKYAATDVHPPLYYYMLKAYASITEDSVLNLRFFSAIPVFFTIVAGCTAIRKLWGDKVAIIFIAVTLLTPLTQYMTSEIRMYSWSMFFVLISFLLAYISYVKGSKSTLILFVFFSLCAAYTHYYALLSVAYIYFIYFVLAILRDKKKLPALFLAAFCFTLGYLPWLFHLVSQLTSVSSDYWISSGLFQGMADSFFPVSAFKHAGIAWLDNRKIEIFIPVIFFAFVLWCAVKAKDRKTLSEALLTASVFLFPVVFGIAYSLIFNPVFIPRYMCCSLGLYFLSFALFLSLMDMTKKLNKGIVAGFFIILTVMSIISLFNKMKFDAGRTAEYEDMVSYIGDNNEHTAILYKNKLSLPFPVLFPEHNHIAYENKIDTAVTSWAVISNAFEHSTINSYDDINPRYEDIIVVNLIKNVSDSTELIRHFDISGYRYIRGIHIHKLKRKE